MIEFAIFSAKAPTQMSPEVFEKLSPADRSLFSRLVQERNASKAFLRKATGLPFTQFSALGLQMHSVRLAGEERVPARRSESRFGDMPETFSRLLRVFSDSDAPLTISYAEMERRAALAKDTAHTCLSGLKNRGLVICLRGGRGGRMATWSITDEGRALADSLFSEVANA